MVALSLVLNHPVRTRGSQSEGPDGLQSDEKTLYERAGPSLSGRQEGRSGGKQHKSGSYLVITVVCPISQRHQTRRPSNSMGSGILGGATTGRADSCKIDGKTNSLQMLRKGIQFSVHQTRRAF